MQKDLKQRYEKLVKCQDHIKINIENMTIINVVRT